MQLLAHIRSLKFLCIGITGRFCERMLRYLNRKEDSTMDPILIFLHVLELLLDGKANEVHPLHMIYFILVCLCILIIIAFVIWSLSLSAGIPTQ